MLISVERIGVGDHDGRAEFVILGRPLREGRDAHSFRAAVFDEDLVDRGAFENMAAARGESAAEVVGEFLRAALGIIIPQEIRQAQHGVEQVGRPVRQRSPVRGIGHQQRLEAWVAKVLVELVDHAELLEVPRALVVDAPEIVEQAVEVRLPQLGEIGFDGLRFLGKKAFQLRQILAEIGGYCEGRHVGEMKLVDRIHLHPLGGDFQFLEELSCESGGIAEERIKVCRCVKDEAAAAEGGTEAAQHVVPFEEQYLQSGLCEEVGAEKAAYA